MDYFEQANLLVVPVQATEFKGERIKYPNYNPKYRPGMPPIRMAWQSDNAQNWVSWEEREDVYPGVHDWFALGGLVTRGRYFKDGVEIGYGVIDVDNHGDTEKFNKTVAFLSSIGWDDTLIVQTPSGGRHYYFWCLADYMPNHSNGCEEYAIEFKTKGGWLTPNGRDRIIISNKPIKRLSLTKDSPFANLVSIKRKGTYSAKKKTDPNFPIEKEEFPEVGPGERHATLISKACSLYARGCPPDKIEWWGYEFYRRTNRKEQPNEVRNAVQNAMNFIDNGETDSDFDLSNLVTEIENEPKEPITPAAPNPLEGAEELTGWEGVFAKSVFSDKEEIKGYVREELKNIPEEDKAFARGMLTPAKMRETWANTPYEKQLKYEPFKDTVKMLLEKP